MMLPDPPELGNEDPQFEALRARTGTAPLIYLIAEDPPRRDDPPEVAAIKASAVIEQWCARLRARGEQVSVVPFAAAGTGGAA